MEILGYSERGIINSLFYELKYKNSLETVNKFLSQISFPYKKVEFKVSNATILVEQSFSQFGTSDGIILIDNHGKKQAVFIEAKVKTSQNQEWTILKEFEQFTQGAEKSLDSSNLFTQLYHKTRLANELKDKGLDNLKKGIPFPECSSRENRKIGRNDVVLRAVEKLIPYCEEALFVAILPDNKHNLNHFYRDVLSRYKPDNAKLPVLDIKNWGYIPWSEIEQLCKDNGLKGTLETFDFNRGQIY